jgi:hypothetical protein
MTAARLKSLIVLAGCWGLLPARFSGWLIRILRLGAA